MTPETPVTPESSNPESSPEEKKAYRTPRLLRWGDICELTKTVGIVGGFDNGLHVTRTSLGGLARVPNSGTKKRSD
jgi:hypothetical protein